VDRIKRLSFEVMAQHKSKFGEDFVDNKKILDQVSIVRSKGLKNEVAGYITKFIKKEVREAKAKQARHEQSKAQRQNTAEEIHEDVVEEIESESNQVVETIESTTDDNSEELVLENQQES
jgi:small subunit ribosomal protein S17e